MIFKRTAQKGIEDVEKTAVKNIANTLLQIVFHTHGTLEEITEYYGWKEPMAESERATLIQDSMRRLESEQLILNFIRNNKKTLKEYAKKYEKGHFDRVIQRTASTSTEQEGGDQSAREDVQRGPGQGTGDDTGLRDTGTEGDNRESETGRDEQDTEDRRGQTGSVRGDDRGRDHEGRIREEGSGANW